MNQQIQWRVKATRALPGLESAKPAGEWADYKSMGKQETKNFLESFSELGEGRSMFEYRVKPETEEASHEIKTSPTPPDQTRTTPHPGRPEPSVIRGAL